ncbi:serine hydrolase, partial [bacterium]|nr:serine hydrolase [bacterium]
KIALLIIFAFFSTTVVPYFLRNVTGSAIFGHRYNSKIKPENYNYLLNPTTKYLYNTDFMNIKALIGTNKKPLMQSIYTTKELTALKNTLETQIAAYPDFEVSIFVWDSSNGNYVDINAEKTFPAASIIKIPVLISLFKAIENGKLKKTDKIPLEEYYRSEGSGSLQYQAQGLALNLDKLARIMITDSDNSATNMLMSAIGSMTAVNNDIKEWGLKNTHINSWLPDLGGTNYTSTKDLGIMLHNLDNEDFLELESRADIFDYMGHVKNNRLLAAGIPENASIAHKTGDIGIMLGDAGIIYSPNGKKYVVAIMVKRPRNDFRAKEFIVNASKTIYNYMTSY